MPRPFKNKNESKDGKDLARLSADLEAALSEARMTLEGGSKISNATLESITEKLGQFTAKAGSAASW